MLDYNNSRIPETESRGPETDTGSLETELRVHRTHGTLERRITKRDSQPGGPSKERPADFQLAAKDVMAEGPGCLRAPSYTEDLPVREPNSSSTFLCTISRRVQIASVFLSSC